MDRILIRGGAPLSGTIPIGGAKNAALPLMAASLLTAEPLLLANLPDDFLIAAGVVEVQRRRGRGVSIDQQVAASPSA